MPGGVQLLGVVFRHLSSVVFVLLLREFINFLGALKDLKDLTAALARATSNPFSGRSP